MAKVLVFGASDNPERYSYKALKALEAKGHNVLLFSPRHDQIEGHKVLKDFSDIPKDIDVLTLYVNPKISSQMIQELVGISPTLTIFNPGTENEGLASQLKISGKTSIDACTLVLLSIDQFDKELETAKKALK